MQIDRSPDGAARVPSIAQAKRELSRIRRTRYRKRRRRIFLLLAALSLWLGHVISAQLCQLVAVGDQYALFSRVDTGLTSLMFGTGEEIADADDESFAGFLSAMNLDAVRRGLLSVRHWWQTMRRDGLFERPQYGPFGLESQKGEHVIVMRGSMLAVEAAAPAYEDADARLDGHHLLTLWPAGPDVPLGHAVRVRGIIPTLLCAAPMLLLSVILMVVFRRRRFKR